MLNDWFQDFSKQRKEQLSLCIKEMVTARDEVTAILAGDLNIRDSEISNLNGNEGLPATIIDVWEHLGRRKDVQYTWVNKLVVTFNNNALCSFICRIP